VWIFGLSPIPRIFNGSMRLTKRAKILGGVAVVLTTAVVLSLGLPRKPDIYVTFARYEDDGKRVVLRFTNQTTSWVSCWLNLHYTNKHNSDVRSSSMELAPLGVSERSLEYNMGFSNSPHSSAEVDCFRLCSELRSRIENVAARAGLDLVRFRHFSIPVEIPPIPSTNGSFTNATQ